MRHKEILDTYGSTLILEEVLCLGSPQGTFICDLTF